MTGGQAAWYVLSVLLYPWAVSVVALTLLAFGVTTWLAYVLAMFGFPVVWVVFDRLLLRYFERQNAITTEFDPDGEWLLLEPEKRPLIR